MKGMKQQVYNLEREEIKEEEIQKSKIPDKFKNSIFIPDIVVDIEKAQMLQKLLIHTPNPENQ
jgi:hypothetical protein